MNSKNLFSHKAFDCISNEQKELFEKLSIQLEGKTPNECMPIIMMFMQNMPKGNELTKNEQESIMEIFLETLSDTEKEQFKLLIKMAKQLSN